MKRFLLSLCLLACLFGTAEAQTACGGVNFVPSPGVSCLLEPVAPTYGATSVALVPVAAGATDFYCLAGSATRVVRLQYVHIAGTAGTLVNVPVLLTKHVSLDTGAASAAGTQIPIPYAFDPSNVAPTATTRAWITANPTITDAAPGIIDSGQLPMASTGTVVGNPGLTFDFRERNFQTAPILRTAVQEICLNLNTTAVTTGLLYITMAWTELPQ
jgi:hypothetical protein